MSQVQASRDEGAELFVRMLIARACDGAIRDTMSSLENGPPGRRPPDARVRQHHWFQGLSGESQQCLQEIVQEAIQAAVFGCLVLLDGMTGGYPVTGQPSDFALFLQIYPDEAALWADSPQSSLRLNPNSTIHENLHDMFKRILDERTEYQP